MINKKFHEFPYIFYLIFLRFLPEFFCFNTIITPFPIPFFSFPWISYSYNLLTPLFPLCFGISNTSNIEYVCPARIPVCLLLKKIFCPMLFPFDSRASHHFFISCVKFGRNNFTFFCGFFSVFLGFYKLKLFNNNSHNLST